MKITLFQMISTVLVNYMYQTIYNGSNQVPYLNINIIKYVIFTFVNSFKRDLLFGKILKKMKGIIDIKNEYNHLPHLTFLLETCKVYALRRKKLDRRITDVRNEITVVFHRSLSDTEQSSWNLRRLYELQQQYKQRTWTY